MIPRRILIAALILLIPPVMTCTDNPSDGGKVVLPTIGDYVVFAWNDLGMHCLNPTYDQAVILPPYNTVWAQVVRRGDPPQIVTSGLTAEYKILGNTYSYGKRSYGQFWDNVTLLFGADLAHDTGLNLEDPGIHNGLSGAMVAKADHFVVSGIPVTPVDDSDEWNPYQIAEITIKDGGGNVVAKTRATVPTSDDINCTRCHGANPFQDVLAKHDAAHATTLVADAPVLCAGCHASPALGGTSPERNYLSKVIHQSHSSRNAACYDCHPGPIMACNRSQGHTAADGNCALCHGDMANVAGTITAGTEDPLGERAEVRLVPRRDHGSRNRSDPLPERVGARRPLLRRLPFEPARDDPVDPGIRQLPGAAVPGQGRDDRKLRRVPHGLEGRVGRDIGIRREARRIESGTDDGVQHLPYGGLFGDAGMAARVPLDEPIGRA